MNRTAVAKELLAIAKDLLAMDFPTQDAYDKYMKEHPDADKSLHTVKETKKDESSKGETTKKDEPKKEDVPEHLKGLDEEMALGKDRFGDGFADAIRKRIKNIGELKDDKGIPEDERDMYQKRWERGQAMLKKLKG